MAANRGPSSKAVRLIGQYELDGCSPELEELWTGENADERRSLRNLAAYFNRQLLQEATTRAGRKTIDGEVKNTYSC